MLTPRSYRDETDYWRIRAFLRDVFLANDRREHSWPVARFDYWRWHLVGNCQLCAPLPQVTTLWETAVGEIAAVLHPVVTGEIRLQVHPRWRTPALEADMLATAEMRLAAQREESQRVVWLPVDTGDTLRQTVLRQQGYAPQTGTSRKWFADLEPPLPEAAVPAGYTIQAMGDENDHSARSWASWRAFHSDEPDENYDGDASWFAQIQRAPLYRRDLDIVARTPAGEIAAFATLYFDDVTRCAVCVLVGTAAEHQRRGLGKAVLRTGFRRLYEMGGTRVFATAYDPPADALYGAVMSGYETAVTWAKQWTRVGD